jgi:hypothetical protein
MLYAIELSVRVVLLEEVTTDHLERGERISELADRFLETTVRWIRMQLHHSLPF